MVKNKFLAVIEKKDGFYQAKCPELGLTCLDQREEVARDKLTETVLLYMLCYIQEISQSKLVPPDLALKLQRAIGYRIKIYQIKHFLSHLWLKRDYNPFFEWIKA